nr:S-4TM family putative pore-forming effector [Rhodococcus sp. (in: high G+C Gram-positive bacteria)]
MSQVEPWKSSAVNELQTQPAVLSRLHAAFYLHGVSHRILAARYIIAILTTAAATTVAIAGVSTSLMAWLGGAGTVVVSVVTVVGQNRTEMGAKVQDEFDRAVYGLVRPDTSSQFSIEAVIRWSDKYQGPSRQDWYADVCGLPRSYGALLCQRQNLQWDGPLRATWVNANITALSVWIVAGLVVAIEGDWTVRDLGRLWLLPGLSLPVLLILVIYNNRRVIQAKAALAIRVSQILSTVPSGPQNSLTDQDDNLLMGEVESIQQQITALRAKAGRVPNWMFQRRQARDQVATTRAVNEIVRRIRT